MTDETMGDGSKSDRGCGYARRRRRRRQRADDLLFQLGLTGSSGWMGDDLMGGESDETLRSKVVARFEEMEKTIETMGETITVLSERVKVLERIVVDDEANIAREIDKLKDDGEAA